MTITQANCSFEASILYNTADVDIVALHFYMHCSEDAYK